MWVAQYYQFSNPVRFYHRVDWVPWDLVFQLRLEHSWLSRANRNCRGGDGGFQMTSQELAVVALENIPVKVAVINNQCLGMVRQWQELFPKNVIVK